jgi:hypothetical protein
MFRESSAIEAPKTIAPAATPKPITEDEYQAIVDRLDATGDIFRQNRELREALSRRESESRTLQSRNAELEEIVRKFGPILLNAATTMGLAVRNEKPEARSQF